MKGNHIPNIPQNNKTLPLNSHTGMHACKQERIRSNSFSLQGQDLESKSLLLYHRKNFSTEGRIKSLIGLIILFPTLTVASLLQVCHLETLFETPLKLF